MQRRVSYAQNAEDIRVWRAFRDADPSQLRYVDVGANEPWRLSITASLYELGWRGVLIEADPGLVGDLRAQRPGDEVLQVAAAAGPGHVTFHRVPGTGLGTLGGVEAEAARARGFQVDDVTVETESLDRILGRVGFEDIHFMSIDVEGAEAAVLSGLALEHIRPWVLCIEAVQAGTDIPNHGVWEERVTGRRYRFAGFDGVNRWYVAEEHADLLDAISVPFNAIDAGADGWVRADEAWARERVDRARAKSAWQRELVLNDIRGEVPSEEYEAQIDGLREELVMVRGSRAHAVAERASRITKGLRARALALRHRLPAPLRNAMVRRRHLALVTANMALLTPPALLGRAAPEQVDWITPAGLPAAPTAGLDLQSLTDADAVSVEEWLRQGPWDDDAMLERRMDNRDDELGRAIAALRLRIDLADRPASPAWAGGNRVLFDARCLQTSAFGGRGIGRFAAAALQGIRDELGDEQLVVLVDRGLDSLPESLVGGCEQIIRVTDRVVPSFSVLVQPSPMTSSARPLLPLLRSNAHKIAIVYDFIPMHVPSVYLADVAGRAEYAAALDALRRYDDFVCISHIVQSELLEVLGRPRSGLSAPDTTVAWPRDVLPRGEEITPAMGSGPIVVVTGDDPRKNTFGGLAAVGAATSADPGRDVVVIGMSGLGPTVHHWSILAMMRAGETRTTDRLSDAEMTDLLREASLVVVPSFDEGLSLPVIEAVRAGAPVVASDIPSHRELIGKGSYLADPRSPRSMARAVSRHLRRPATQRRQHERLSAHRHAPLEAVMAKKVRTHLKPAAVAVPPASVFVGGRDLRVALAGPWTPQRSGVADFTTTTTLELARCADVTVFTTAGADVAASIPEGVRLRSGRVDDLLRHGHQSDVLVSVMGNSHFHLPFLQLIGAHDSVVVTHDTRLVEFYLALRAAGGVQQVMLRGTGASRLSPPLDEQIDDMRLLQNLGFWEVARRARMLIAHTPTAAERMAAETGVPVTLLPFANQRVPDVDHITPEMRARARQRLGMTDDAIHLASFGFVDIRTKMSDVVLESAGWLQQWGHRVHLHLVGSAPGPVAQSLNARAGEIGLEGLHITGFADESTYRDYLIACDLGVQLRISPVLGVSGPLSDMSAFGTPAVASRGLATDVDAPGFVDRLPDDVSPVLVAEAIERRLAEPLTSAEAEAQRRAYLAAKSPARYAELLLGLLDTAARTPNEGEG